MANEIKIGITGEDAGLQAALGRAQTAVSGAVGQMQAALGSLQSAFGRINTAFAAFAAVLGGGAALKQAVETTVNLAKESLALAKQFGISATEASVLKVALDDVFVSQDAMSAAGNRITQALKKNESAFHDLGVATRDSNGDFRNTFDIMQDVNARLLQFKEGTDRNVEGVKIYGKAWAEVAPTLKLTSAVTEEARAKAESLGLVIGDESVAATKRYRSAMNDVHDVFTGVEKTIGDAVLPALTRLAEWFRDIGPAVVLTFQRAIAGIRTEFALLVAGCKALWHAGLAVVDTWGTLTKAFSDSENAILHLDLSGAVSVWKDAFKKIKDDGVAAWKKIKADVAEASQSIGDAWDRVGHQDTPSKRDTSASETSEGGDERIKNQMANLEKGLELEKLAYQKRIEAGVSYREYSKEQELAYWEKVLNTQHLSQENSVAVERKTLQLKLEIRKEGFERELAENQVRLAAAKGDFDQQLNLAREFAEKVKTSYPDDVNRQKQAAKQIEEIERAKLDHIQALRERTADVEAQLALLQVDAAQQAADFEEQSMLITHAQALAKEQEFEDQRFEIQREALQKKLQLLALDPTKNVEAIAALNAQIAELEEQRQLRMQKIQQQSALEANRNWRSAFASIQSGWASVLSKFLSGTMTFRDFMRGMFTSVLDAITNTLAEMTAQWLTNLLVQKVMGKATSASTISAHAAEAGAAATASAAAIPIYGWAMAPEAGAAAFSAAMAYQAVAASAAKGYDIPAGVNPLLHAHEKEMVLPQKHADVIRSLADEGGGRGRGREIHMHTHVNAVDARSFQQQLRNPRSGLNNAIKDLARRAGHLIPSY